MFVLDLNVFGIAFGEYLTYNGIAFWNNQMNFKNEV